MRRGVEIKRARVIVPHNEIAFTQKVFHGAAVAAVRDAQSMLYVGRTEPKVECVLVAAEVEV